ncbi:MAG: PadR family transcriptional regulator [Candidatus Thermoplasmatota archaeon]|nr:PadR family transcriptional regulator [Candidatus Thermoplasmatota archaeon]
MGKFRGFGLRYWVLSILSGEPSTGSMIMDKIEGISMGHWRPSPGHVYPLLNSLTTEGYLTVESREGKKYYSLTSKGIEIIERSWFPWRTVGGFPGFNGLEDALKNIEILADYILDNKEKATANDEFRDRIKKVLERLSSM